MFVKLSGKHIIFCSFSPFLSAIFITPSDHSQQTTRPTQRRTIRSGETLCAVINQKKIRRISFRCDSSDPNNDRFTETPTERECDFRDRLLLLRRDQRGHGPSNEKLKRAGYANAPRYNVRYLKCRLLTENGTTTAGYLGICPYLYIYVFIIMPFFESY